MPKKLYKLHATRVDRIAIVDQPAVPDAEILIFKRKPDEDIDQGAKSSEGEKFELVKFRKEFIEKMFSDFPKVKDKVCEKALQTGMIASFLHKATQGAVEALQEEVLNTIYIENGMKDVGKGIEKSFAEFSTIVKNVLMKIIPNSQKQVDAERSQLTKEDVAKPFARGIGYVAISETFSYFKNYLTYLMMGYEELAKPEEVVEEVIKLFKEFVEKNFTIIVENKKDLEKVFEKEGRIISSARLRRLKASLSIIAELVQEAEARYEKSEKEENGMELKELIEKFDKFSAEVNKVTAEITSEFAVMKQAMRDAGYLKTEAEIKEAKDAQIEADKKAEEEKVEADKKAEAEKVEAEKKDLEKRRGDLGLDEKATKEDIEKKEKEIADAKAKFATELPARLEKAEAVMKSFVELTKVLEKRLGIKASIQEDVVTDKQNDDPFAKALRG